MVHSNKYTKDEFFTEWNLIAQEFHKNPDNILTKAMIESVLITHNLPPAFIQAHFLPMMDYCDGKKISEIDEDVIEEYAQEIFQRACDQGIATTE
ncbi:unnamed protein product [Moneuplotes crassus]|uniref:Uncharacterized protein n=1 Tax=Euplotes crassus TaxID=5936 RepID=A0AAD1Y6I3_EUPCR|nr:unnamed protein product [Moneuplotes crassus]